jgi:hypothetical protein
LLTDNRLRATICDVLLAGRRGGGTARVDPLPDHGHRVRQGRTGELPERRAHREEANMKRGPAIFLQVVVVLVGIGAIALLLWEPQIEGRNKHATLFEVYFQDPFLAYVYVASIPFFVAVVQAFKVLGYAGRNQVFSQAAVRSLRTIKRCAIAIIGFVAGAEVIILSHGNEDRAGGVFMGIVIAFASVVIATAAAVFERILQNAVDIKAENDLTV